MGEASAEFMKRFAFQQQNDTKYTAKIMLELTRLKHIYVFEGPIKSLHV